MKYCKLIKVDIGEVQSNKFYEMQEQSNNTFKVSYGRVGNSPATEEYPMSRWDSKYREKLRKGYKDVSSIVSKTSSEYLSEKIPQVDFFITLMRNYTKNLVNSTYQKVEGVTSAMVGEAQRILDTLSICTDEDRNKNLLELYTIIPRNMRNVRDNLLPHINFAQVVQREQDNIDALKSQIVETTGESSYLESIGLTIEPTQVDKDLEYIFNQLYSVKNIFKVRNEQREENFKKFLENKKNKETKILIHGTRNTSVLPILETDLKIRPSGNFVYSGSVYGNGIYFSQKTSKSLNYTGGDRDKVLLIYEVHTGEPFVYEGWYRGNSFTLCKEELEKRGFDSTHVKAGNGLLNDEIIVYEENKFNLKYIIHI